MHRSGRLQALKSIVAVQRLRRTQAEVRAAEALHAQEAADSAADVADERTELASTEWQDHVGGPAHDPAYGRWLAERLIARVSEADQAQARAGLAARVAERRNEKRQMADGTVRAGERSLKRLSAQAARRREEKRLDRVADRVTYRWLKS
jgi:hypothetical protein